MQVRKQQLEHGTTDWFQIGKGVCQGFMPKSLPSLERKKGLGVALQAAPHGGVSAASGCAFTHRVAFEEGSGPWVKP